MDKFAYANNEIGPGLTREFCEKWLNGNLNICHRSRYDIYSALIQFSKYLNDIDIDSYVPKLIKYYPNNHVPYIYTNEQMTSLFEALDNLRITADYVTGLVSIPALIRLLFATGVRVGEAISIKHEDVNFKGLYIKVTDSKNLRERILPISQSLSDVLIEYLNYKKQLREIKCTNFFVKTDGSSLTKEIVYRYFTKCLEIAGIRGDGKLIRPRVHDLRHTFAVNSLIKMIELGNDPYVALPVLSKYLGHSSIRATDTYVRLTSNMYPGLIKNFEEHIINVFPKNDEQ